MKLIELTLFEDVKVLVNADLIWTIREKDPSFSSKDHSILETTDGTFLFIEENIKDVIRMIKE